MPIHYRLDPAANRLRTTCVGDIQFDEVIAHFDELAADAQARDRRWDVLLDLSECSSLPTPEQLRDVTSKIAHVAAQVRFARVAIVATRDALYGLVRMFVVYAEDFFGPTQVVRTVPEGEAWLDRRV